LPEKEVVNDWSQGVPLEYLKELNDYWRYKYDFSRLSICLNNLPQFIVNIEDFKLHFLHIRSKITDAKPLLISHGWPGSILEFVDILPRLTDPESFGGSAKDAFHVVCPSIPGFGFSEKPMDPGWGVAKIASCYKSLMKKLGYQSYFAQGGDWGSTIVENLAIQDPSCIAIHLNMLTVYPPKTLDKPSEEEQKALERLTHYSEWDSGYSHQQRTRPQTIGYSLVDSPVGLLAWIIEKFWAWTDCDGHPENALNRDCMLDNVMLYWLTRTGASSARLYWESFGKAELQQVHTPVGVSNFPKEIFYAPRAWAEQRYTNIQYWNDVDKGGHFAAMEQPDLFVGELRQYFAKMRS